MNSNCNLSAGTIIKGKWHRHSYEIERLLGKGAVGEVYLARNSNGYVALKISENSAGITSEVNVLKKLAEAQGSDLGPSLIDVDDYEHPLLKKTIPFYVMEYIKGEHFISFVQKRGVEWIDILILQLLNDLENLHRNGWVFGDLKPDNLIVSYPPAKVRCIDVGGTTRIGRSIKEFTEFFDRGYWECGTRRAEPSYDLFAVSMIMINAVYPKRFSKDGKGKEKIVSMIDSHPYLRKRKSILYKAISNSYSSALIMRREIIDVIADEKEQRAKGKVQVNRKQYKKQRKKKSSGFFETVFILVFIAFLYSLYVFTHLL